MATTASSKVILPPKTCWSSLSTARGATCALTSSSSLLCTSRWGGLSVTVVLDGSFLTRWTWADMTDASFFGSQLCYRVVWPRSSMQLCWQACSHSSAPNSWRFLAKFVRVLSAAQSCSEKTTQALPIVAYATLYASCVPALCRLRLSAAFSFEGVAARLHASITRPYCNCDGRTNPRFRAGTVLSSTFSPNAAKMATPETFSETGSETMYEKV